MAPAEVQVIPGVTVGGGGSWRCGGGLEAPEKGYGWGNAVAVEWMVQCGGWGRRGGNLGIVLLVVGMAMGVLFCPSDVFDEVLQGNRDSIVCKRTRSVALKRWSVGAVLVLFNVSAKSILALPIKTMLRHTNLNTFAGSDGGGWDGGKGSVLFGQVFFFHMYAVYHFPLLFTIKKHSFFFFCMSSSSLFCTFRTSSSARVFCYHMHATN
jgi:hypothetical protein